MTKKKKPDTLQVVMSEREIELLERLAALLKRSKSEIFIECARQAIECNCCTSS
jgi:hypothetical protein